MSAETLQTLNESRAFGLLNGTRITHDVYMKDVGLQSTCTRDPKISRSSEGDGKEGGKEKRRGGEDGRRSTKCEITGIGHETEERARVATHNAISRESNGSRA